MFTGRAFILSGGSLAAVAMCLSAAPAPAQTEGSGLLAAPVVTLTLADPAIAENGGSTTVTATLNRAMDGPVTVTLAPSPGFYTVGSDATIAIPKGATSNASDTATVRAADDDLDNVGGRSAEVTGTARYTPDDYDPSDLDVTGATLALEDDEPTPTAVLELSPAAISRGGSAAVTASLDGKSSAAVTLAVAAAPGAHAAAADFALSSVRTLTVAAGATASTGAVTIAAAAGGMDGPDKAVTVSAAVSGSSGVADPASATLTIRGGAETSVLPAGPETPPAVTLALTDSSIPENGGSTTVTATLDRASTAPTTLAVAGAAGLYAAGADATILIPAGSTSNPSDTATVLAVDDDVDNVGGRSATVTASASNSAGVGSVIGAALTLEDDEPTPTAALALSPESVAEGGVSAVTATLSGKSSAAVTLTVAAAPGANAAAADFALSGARTLTFAAGATASAGTVTVTVVDDAVAGPNKAVAISAAASGGAVADPAGIALVIVDDDGGAQERSRRRAPVAAVTADAGRDRRAVEGDEVTLEGSGGGPAGAALAYAWRQTGGAPAAALTNADSARATFAAPEVSATAVLTFALTVTAGGATATDTVHVTVVNRAGRDAGDAVAVAEADLAPAFGAGIGDLAWRQNRAVAPIVLPAAEGGDGALSYTLAPALPEGAALDAAARRLSGTPTAFAPRTRYTWTATDADGDTAAIAFHITVEEDLAPVFDPDTGPDLVFELGETADPAALPAARGGDGALRYRLYPPAPRGMRFDAAARVLSGRPTALLAPTLYTLTATDEDGDSAALTFVLEVMEGLALRRALRGVNAAILPELARAMTASTLAQLRDRVRPGGRIEAAAPPAGALAAARRLEDRRRARGPEWADAAADDGAEWRELVRGAAFAVPLAGGGPGASAALWGAGDHRRLRVGADGPVSWDGGVSGAHAGLSARFGPGGRYASGLTASWFQSRVDWTDRRARGGGASAGVHELRMASVHPYVGWSSPGGAFAWAAAGHGKGRAAVIDPLAGRRSSRSAMTGAAAGGGARLFAAGGTTLELRGEAWATRLSVDGDGGLVEALSVDVQRIAATAEAAREFALPRGAVRPWAELGARWDGGDGEAGAGLEAGGGVAYRDDALGLEAEAAGRVLLAHGGDLREWGVEGALRAKPDARGRGLSLSVLPAWGESRSGLVGLRDGGAAAAPRGPRLDIAAGYGLHIDGGALLTPYGGAGLAKGGGRRWRAGVRIALGDGFDLDFETVAEEGPHGSPERRAALTARLVR